MRFRSRITNWKAGQLHDESRTATELAFDPDATLVGEDDLLGYEKSKPQAGNFACADRASKTIENPFTGTGGDPYALIAHPKANVTSAILNLDGD
jgi:hypothetical protein